MALGFTSHYTNANNHEFGTLILSNNDNETETSGSIAFYNNDAIGSLLYSNCADSYEFSVSVSIDYSQYSSFVAAANSAETAGSVACGSFGGFSSCDSGGSVSSFSGGGGFSSCSSGGGGCSAATYTC